jgi:hypothetical protein
VGVVHDLLAVMEPVHSHYKDTDCEAFDLAEECWFLNSAEKKKTLFGVTGIPVECFAHETKEEDPSLCMGGNISRQ